VRWKHFIRLAFLAIACVPPAARAAEDIVLADRKPPGVIRNATRRIALAGSYLNVPVKTGAPTRRMTLWIDGQMAREFDIELADGRPDFWAFIDVSTWKGKTADLRVDRLPGRNSAATPW